MSNEKRKDNFQLFAGKLMLNMNEVTLIKETKTGIEIQSTFCNRTSSSICFDTITSVLGRVLYPFVLVKNDENFRMLFNKNEIIQVINCLDSDNKENGLCNVVIGDDYHTVISSAKDIFNTKKSSLT